MAMLSSAAYADEVTFDFLNNDYGLERITGNYTEPALTLPVTVKEGDVSIALSLADGTPNTYKGFYFNSTGLGMNKTSGNQYPVLTFTAGGGKIEKIVMTLNGTTSASAPGTANGSDWGYNASAKTYTFTSADGVDEVVGTVNTAFFARAIQKIVVTYTPGVTAADVTFDLANVTENNNPYGNFQVSSSTNTTTNPWWTEATTLTNDPVVVTVQKPGRDGQDGCRFIHHATNAHQQGLMFRGLGSKPGSMDLTIDAKASGSNIVGVEFTVVSSADYNFSSVKAGETEFAVEQTKSRDDGAAANEWTWTWTGDVETLTATLAGNTGAACVSKIVVKYAGGDVKVLLPADLSFSAKEAAGSPGLPFTAPTLNNPNNLPVIWSTSDSSLATVDENGVVTMLKAGVVNVIAASAKTDEYAAGTASYTLTIIGGGTSAPAIVKAIEDYVESLGGYTKSYYHHKVYVGCDFTVKYVNKSGTTYYYNVVDPEGNPALFLDEGQSSARYAAGDVIPLGWIALSQWTYDDPAFLMATEMPASTEKKEVVIPTQNTAPADTQNLEVVTLTNVYFPEVEVEEGKESIYKGFVFTGEMQDAAVVNIFDQFNLDEITPGLYNITGEIGNFYNRSISDSEPDLKKGTTYFVPYVVEKALPETLTAEVVEPATGDAVYTKATETETAGFTANISTPEATATVKINTPAGWDAVYVQDLNGGIGGIDPMAEGDATTEEPAEEENASQIWLTPAQLGGMFVESNEVTVPADGETYPVMFLLAKNGKLFYGAPYTMNVTATQVGQGSKKPAELSFPQAVYSAAKGSGFSMPELTNPNNLVVTYSSSDTEIVELNDSSEFGMGIIVNIKANKGSVTITAKSAETDEFEAGEASFVLNILPRATNVAALLTAAPEVGDEVVAGLSLYVAYANGNELWAYDYLDNPVLLIADNASEYKPGDVISSSTTSYTVKNATADGIVKWAVQGNLPAAGAYPETPNYPVVNEVSTADVNRVVTLKSVTFAEATPAEGAFSGTMGDATVNFVNKFATAPALPGTYDVIAVISLADGAAVAYPVAFNEEAAPDPELPTALTVTSSNPDANINVTYIAENDWGTSEFQVTIGVKATEVPVVVEIPEGWDAMYVYSAEDYSDENIGGGPVMAYRDAAAMWVEESQLTANGFKKANAFTLPATAAGNSIDMTLYFGRDGKIDVSKQYMLSFMVSDTTGVDGVEAADADAEYYTLQGVKVQNPESGFYVKVSNGKAERVYIK